MTFDWDQVRPEWELSEPQKSLIREIGEKFLGSGTGLPDHPKRVELGKQRGLLNELSQFGFISNISNKYYPTFAGLFFLTPDRRDYCAEATDIVFRAIQSLFKKQGALKFSLKQISDEANLLASGTAGERRTAAGVLFTKDFQKYLSNFDYSQDIPIVSAWATENILDYESLQQAWKEELELRPRPQPNPSRTISKPKGKRDEGKTTLLNEASEDRTHDSAELIRLASEAEVSRDLARAEELLRRAVAQATKLKDDRDLIDAEGALAAILAQGSHPEEAEEHYKRSADLARTTKNNGAEARALVGLGRLLEDRKKVRRSREAYLRVRDLAANAPSDSTLRQFGQEADSRLAEEAVLH